MDHAELEMLPEHPSAKDTKKAQKEKQDKLKNLLQALAGHAAGLAGVVAAAARAPAGFSPELCSMVVNCAARIAAYDKAEQQPHVAVCRQVGQGCVAWVLGGGGGAGGGQRTGVGGR